MSLHQDDGGSISSVGLLVQLVLREDDIMAIRPVFRRIVEEHESAAAWTRDRLEEINNHHWLLVAALRHPAVRAGKAKSCLVSCGDGYDILVVFNRAKVPKNVYRHTVPRVKVNACLADSSDGTFVEENPHEHYGDIGSHECLVDHMEIMQATSKTPIRSFRIYLDIEARFFVPIHPTTIRDKKSVFRYHVSSDWSDVKSVEREPFDPSIFSASLRFLGPTNKKSSCTKEPPKKKLKVSNTKRSPAAHAAKADTSLEDQNKVASNKTAENATGTIQECDSLASEKPLSKQLAKPTKTRAELSNTKRSPGDADGATADDSTLEDQEGAQSNETGENVGKIQEKDPSASDQPLNTKLVKEAETTVDASVSAEDHTVDNAEIADDTDMALETRCYYFPFCKLLAKDCGGIRKGCCNDVKSGKVELPPKKEFKAARKRAKKEAKKARKAERKKAKEEAKKTANRKKVVYGQAETRSSSEDGVFDNEERAGLKFPAESSAEIGIRSKERMTTIEAEVQTGSNKTQSAASVKACGSLLKRQTNNKVELPAKSSESPTAPVDSDDESYDMSKQDKVIRLFEGLADQWDNICSNYAAAIYKVLWSTTGIDPSTRPFVVDVGCGTGVLTGLMRLDCAEILAIDATPEMVKVLQHKQREGDDWSNVNALCIVLAQLFEKETPNVLAKWEGKADLVVATRTMSYIPKENLNKSMKAIGGLLKPGGIFCHSDPPLSSLQFQPKLSKGKAESMHAMAGLDTLSLDKVTLDLGDGTVDELICVARKPSTDVGFADPLLR